MTQERTCIVCRAKKNKSEFVRIVFNKSGQIILEENKKLDGRGASVCKNTDCADKLFKTHALNRTFKHNFSEQEYKTLIEKIKNA